jgi:nickel-type superoxide dismutase maturation protease
MKSPKSSGQPKKPKLLVRRVSGSSMLPTLKPKKLVVAKRSRKLKPGQLIIIRHDGLEKVKRIAKLTDDKVFVLGDNPADSTDSRSFGWLSRDKVAGTVIWPHRKRRLSLDAPEPVHRKPNAHRQTRKQH